MIFPLTSAFDRHNNNRCDVDVFLKMKNEIRRKLMDLEFIICTNESRFESRRT